MKATFGSIRRLNFDLELDARTRIIFPGIALNSSYVPKTSMKSRLLGSELKFNLTMSLSLRFARLEC
jgi:hypothetical protein